jgi:hypothetical protein
MSSERLNPNVAYLYRGKTRKSNSNVAAHRLGQVEAYLTVREVLSEASTAVPPRRDYRASAAGFYWFRYATLGYIQPALCRLPPAACQLDTDYIFLVPSA